MRRKDTFVEALGQSKRKGWVKLGFDANSCGLGSKEDVVAYLDEEQKQWEETRPSYKLTQIRDEIREVIHLGIGGSFWYGHRFFFPVRRQN
ncbi:MAG: hypothetical protein AAB672_01615 [Patescibacteria group bacterium]